MIFWVRGLGVPAGVEMVGPPSMGLRHLRKQSGWCVMEDRDPTINEDTCVKGSLTRLGLIFEGNAAFAISI